MKKRCGLFATVILFVCLLLMLVGCDFLTETDSSAGVSGKTPKFLVVIASHSGDYVIGEEIDLSEIKIRVVYSDKTTSDITVDDFMIDTADYDKFFTVGTHTVTIVYEGLTVPLQISVVSEEKVESYRAVFFSVGGTSVETQYTSQVTAFPVPEREGYYFDGWYTNINYEGSRLREPYVLTEDTNFYAKWIDRRVCTVTFYDSVDMSVVRYTEQVHYGEKIDIDSYEYPWQTVGKTFVRWYVANGNASSVTEDLHVFAEFQIDKCTVSIYYFNSNDKEIHVENTYDYGTILPYGEYTMPTKEGYSSRWVFYYNHSKVYACTSTGCEYTKKADSLDNTVCPVCGGNLEETGFIEEEEAVDEDLGYGKITLTEPYTLIQAHHVINTYDIVIKNGILGQNEDFLKAGNIQLENIYQDAAAHKNFSVDWNGTFDCSQYTQDPKLDTPANISDGYLSQWCFVIKDANDKETWMNTSGYVWDEELKEFVEPDEWISGESKWNWTLRNSQGEYMATVQNGIPVQIKSDLNIYAKYIKNNFTVGLRREYNNAKGMVAKFTVAFYDDFNLYYPQTYLESDSYVFSPDKETETDPVYDPVIRNKIALYEKAYIYDLYKAYTLYKDVLSRLSSVLDTMIADEGSDEVDKAVYLSYKTETERKKIAALCAWFYLEYDNFEIYRAESGEFSDKMTAMKELYANNKKDYGDDLWSIHLSEMVSLYKQYFEELKDYIGYYSEEEVEGVTVYREIFGDEGTGFFGDTVFLSKINAYENAWNYYYGTPGYKFYVEQLPRSSATVSKLMMAKDYEFNGVGTDSCRKAYAEYKNTASYLYFLCGLTEEETQVRRQRRLELCTETDVEQFYRFADTDETVKSYADFYGTGYPKDDETYQDWALKWYKNAEKTPTGLVDFLSGVVKTITVMDDVTLYSNDIDQRKYRLTFYFGYDFGYDGTTDIADQYKNISEEVYSGTQEVDLPVGYAESAVRTVEGVNTVYDFLGWFDVPYYTYLTTGVRGEQLSISATHTENVDYYAHYVCQTTYTVTIFDATQSMAYNGIADYANGHEVAADTVKYVLSAGSVLNIMTDVYKGVKITQEHSSIANIVSGQEYFRQQRYIDYFDEYYSTVDESSLYYGYASNPTASITELKSRKQQYQAILTEYEAVVQAAKNHDYSAYTKETFRQYLYLFPNVAGSGNAVRHAFVEEYLNLLGDLAQKEYDDISTFTKNLTQYLPYSARYYKATSDAMKHISEWSVYYSNYYTFDGSTYTPADENTAPDGETEYYRYFISSDYEYYVLICDILDSYCTFIEKFEEYQTNRNSYALQPKNEYFDSMNNINAAYDYDYEGSGEMKYNFIGWYTDPEYSVPFLAFTDKGYYEATEEAKWDNASWEEIYSAYKIYSDGEFASATAVYNASARYFEYNAERYYVSTDVASSTQSSGVWGDNYTDYYTYNEQTAKYEPATDIYNAAVPYYTHYHEVTTVLSTHQLGWENNRTKYYIWKNNEYVQVNGVYDAESTYYRYNAMYMEFVVSQDIVLYAKWLDISRGTEGLVYELVYDETTGEDAYVVIDFVNLDESKEADYYKTTKQYYYVTSNDSGHIPNVIANEGDKIELQIPAEIVGYREATASALDDYENGIWSATYQNYLTLNTESFTYVAATDEFDEKATYYDMNEQKTYPVIGIRADALDRYKAVISIINLPLNLYFIEEGAFESCPIQSIARAKARTVETPLNYITVDIQDEVGVAIYQEDVFLDQLISRSGYTYQSEYRGNTLLAYAVGNENYLQYSVKSTTEHIGNYVFRNARSLRSVEFEEVLPVLETIGDYAFDMANIGEITIVSSVTEIGEYCFYQATDLTYVYVQNGASLMSVGNNAFVGTEWYDRQKGIAVLSWNVPGTVKSVVVGLNMATGAGHANYDADGTGQLIRYDEDGNESASGDYVAISAENGLDKILYYYPSGSSDSVLDRFIIQSEIVSLAKGAFENSAVRTVVLNARSLQKIDDYAFSGCAILSELTFKNASEGVDVGIGVFSGMGNKTLTVTDASGKVRTGDGWDAYENIIK